MNDPTPTTPAAAVRQRRGIPLVWLLPIVTAGIGLFLAWQSYQNRGISVVITFEDAEGLEAGKTPIKYKAVDVGLVQTVRLSRGSEHIEVEATVDRYAEECLTEGTRFWVVRPRVGREGISGLTTLVSGSYIALDPAPGPPVRSFRGLEFPPVTATNMPGLKLALFAQKLGSLDRGSPIYYRDIQVGQVEDYRLREHDRGVEIDIFVDAPHHERIRSNSRFWNASGLDISLDANGFDVRMQSLDTLIQGGIAFETPSVDASRVRSGDRFRLYERYADVEDSFFTEKLSYVMFFDRSVRGLSAGAPVEYRGVRIGSVRDVRLQIDPETVEIVIPVYVDFEPERIRVFGDHDYEGFEDQVLLSLLVARGLRARLETASLVTGQLFVALDFVDEAAPVTMGLYDVFPVFPTVPSTLEHITEAAMDVIAKLRALPLEDLLADAREAVDGIRAVATSPEWTGALETATVTLNEARRIVAAFDERVGAVARDLEHTTASARDVMSEAERVLVEIRDSIEPSSPLRYELTRALQEFSAASRSIRVLAGYLERHPDSVIKGKPSPGDG